MPVFVLLIILFSMQTGCNSAPKTTRLHDTDILETTDVMSNSLNSSLFFAECQSSKTPIKLSYQKAENLSTDMLRPSEQWLFVERVIDSTPVQELKSNFNITSVRAAEKMGRVYKDRDVTHVMTATVTSVTRDAYKDVTDAYKCQYEIVSLKTGEVVWSNSYEIKRVATGLSWD